MTPEQVRAAMPDDMRRACDGLRTRFGARLVYLHTPTLTVGDKRHAHDDMDACRERHAQRETATHRAREG